MTVLYFGLHCMYIVSVIKYSKGTDASILNSASVAL